MISSITYVWYVLYASKQEETCVQPDNNNNSHNNNDKNKNNKNNNNKNANSTYKSN